MRVLVEWSGQRMLYEEVDELMHDDDEAGFPMVRMTFKGDRREPRLFDPAQASIQVLPTEPS